MFTGIACFSPQVCSHVRLAWQKNGGTIATSVSDLESVSFFFATVQDNYWIQSLRSISVPVYDEAWILDSVQRGDVAFSHCYTLSGGLQPGLVRHAVWTDETAAPGSQDTLMGDETASDLEVERTLVEGEDVHRMVLEKQPITQARQLLELLKPPLIPMELPEAALGRILEVPSGVCCVVSFRAGGYVRSRCCNPGGVSIVISRTWSSEIQRFLLPKSTLTPKDLEGHDGH